jgi:hypothetical protein
VADLVETPRQIGRRLLHIVLQRSPALEQRRFILPVHDQRAPELSAEQVLDPVPRRDRPVLDALVEQPFSAR